MNAPPFLPVVLSVLMLVLAVYSAWRVGAARAWGRGTDLETELLHFAAGLAAAGLLSTWARTLPREVWAVLFAVAAVYFALRAARGWAEQTEVWRAPLARAGVCAVLVYCFLAGVAPSTIHGSTAGQVTMAGMPGMIKDETVDLPALGLILAAALAFAAVAVVGRLSPETDGETAVAAPPVAATPAGTVLLAPRSVALCRVALLIALAYAILSKIV